MNKKDSSKRALNLEIICKELKHSLSEIAQLFGVTDFDFQNIYNLQDFMISLIHDCAMAEAEFKILKNEIDKTVNEEEGKDLYLEMWQKTNP